MQEFHSLMQRNRLFVKAWSLDSRTLRNTNKRFDSGHFGRHKLLPNRSGLSATVVPLAWMRCSYYCQLENAISVRNAVKTVGERTSPLADKYRSSPQMLSKRTEVPKLYAAFLAFPGGSFAARMSTFSTEGGCANRSAFSLDQRLLFPKGEPAALPRHQRCQ